jgi:hypothetical protein
MTGHGRQIAEGRKTLFGWCIGVVEIKYGRVWRQRLASTDTFLCHLTCFFEEHKKAAEVALYFLHCHIFKFSLLGRIQYCRPSPIPIIATTLSPAPRVALGRSSSLAYPLAIAGLVACLCFVASFGLPDMLLFCRGVRAILLRVERLVLFEPLQACCEIRVPCRGVKRHRLLRLLETISE